MSMPDSGQLTLFASAAVRIPTPERIFSDWNAPFLPAVAERLVETYRQPASVRMDGALLVMGGARGGRRLKELLVEASERSGLPLVPPRVVTIGALPELLYTPRLPAADAILARRVWARALRHLERADLDLVFPHAPPAEDLRGRDVLAGEVQRLREAVSAGGHDFASVARLCAGAGHAPPDEEGRWAVLARVEAAYRELLASIGAADALSERIAAVDEARLAPTGDVWLVGVTEMPALTRRMVEALSSPVRAFVHAPAAEATGFDATGCVLAEHWVEREIAVEDGHLRVHGRPADLADGVVRELAALGDGFDVSEVVVAAADPELVPYVEGALEGGGVAARWAGGTPLARTGPVRLLEALAEYLNGARWEGFSAVVRHPDVPGWLQRAAGLNPDEAVRIAAAADEYHARHLPASLGVVRSASRGYARHVDQARAAVDRLVERLRGRRRLAVRAPEILAVLTDVYGHRRLRRDDPADQRLAAALEALRDAAAAFHRLPSAVDEECEAAEALALLLAEVRSRTVPDEGGGAAIELLGWLELHLDDSPVAMVAGLNEGALPESVNEDAFLPDAMRTRLGLVDNAGRYARDAYQLTALLHSRRVVRLFAGRTDAAGNPLRPSRLALALRGDALAHRVRDLAAEVSEAAAPVERDAGVSFFQLPPRQEIHFEPPQTISVTAFALLLQDPYRWALERHLGLAPLDDAAREMDGMLFGSVAHEVLQAFGHAPEAASDDERAVRRWLDARLEAEADRRFGRGALPAVRLQLEQLRSRLHAFGAWQAAHAGEGWEIAWVEGRPAGSVAEEGTPTTASALFEVDGTPITIRGRIDRIDRNRETGAWAVLDYKTGDVARTPEQTHRRGRSEKEWIDLQLPLYRHLAAGVPGPDGGTLIPSAALRELALGYLCLPRDLQKVGAHFAQWSPGELDEADEAARAAVRLLRLGRVRFDEQRALRFGDGPLAPLLGLRQLVATAEEEEEENGE
jgi:ATP-dependent helicase/nuclease subunit B